MNIEYALWALPVLIIVSYLFTGYKKMPWNEQLKDYGGKLDNNTINARRLLSFSRWGRNGVITGEVIVLVLSIMLLATAGNSTSLIYLIKSNFLRWMLVGALIVVGVIGTIYSIITKLKLRWGKRPDKRAKDLFEIVAVVVGVPVILFLISRYS